MATDTALPDRPPVEPLRHRSASWQQLAQATPPGGLALPHCPACAHVFYPPQPFCPRCLAQPVSAREVSGLGRVLSVVPLMRPLAPFFQARTPVAVARVQMASPQEGQGEPQGTDRREGAPGPALFALAVGPLCAGQAVRVQLHRGPPHVPADPHDMDPPGVLVAQAWPTESLPTKE